MESFDYVPPSEWCFLYFFKKLSFLSLFSCIGLWKFAWKYHLVGWLKKLKKFFFNRFWCSQKFSYPIIVWIVEKLHLKVNEEHSKWLSKLLIKFFVAYFHYWQRISGHILKNSSCWKTLCLFSPKITWSHFYQINIFTLICHVQKLWTQKFVCLCKIVRRF